MGMRVTCSNCRNKVEKVIAIQIPGEKYNKYLIDCSDIYEIYIKQIINSECLGGILILPSNFLFSFNNKLRKVNEYTYPINKI